MRLLHREATRGRELNLGWLGFGLIVVALGVLFLLDAMGVLNVIEAIHRWWPLLLVAVGLVVIASAEIRFSVVLGCLLASAGILLVLKWDVWGYVWPALVLAAGLFIVSCCYSRETIRSTARVVGAPERFHIHGRMLLVQGAYQVGSAIAWMCTGWRPASVMLALAAVTFVVLDPWLFVLYAALLLMWFAVKTKRRIVIETFEDHVRSSVQLGESGDSADVTDRPRPHCLDASGLAALLATKLAEMRDLYQVLEEPLARPRPGPVERAPSGARASK